MAHELFRLSSQVFNTPQLVEANQLRAIAEYFNYRNSPTYSDPIYQGGTGKGLDTEEPNIFNGVGVIQIDGVITYKEVDAMCAPEGTSYLSLIEEVDGMIKAGVKAIVFECSSGGGEARGLFSTATVIREKLSAAGVYSLGYIDTIAASACYGLVCICDEVIIHPEAQAGSIGAMIALQDGSKAMEMNGYKEIYVVSTPGKIPFAADGSFKESFLNKLQEDVTKLGDKFVAHVSKYTGISTEDIKAMDAQMFDAETCLSNGLVNSIMTHEQFSSYIAGKYN